jgi:hypothetical protein
MNTESAAHQTRTPDKHHRICENGYTLALNGDQIDQIWSDNPFAIITWRPISIYGQLYPQILANDLYDKQVFEVGPGLAEFIPDFALVAKNKPIIADPIDLPSVIRLLNTAKRRGLSAGSSVLADVLIERAEILLSDKIIFYNMTLEKAVLTYPEKLSHVADLVIDVQGAKTYAKNLQKTLELENNFLKKPRIF